ncbi:hypothetical protein P8907_20185 [Bacillus atrophaeus]|uniref:hypothetical protein n=1 Tax=Bacillus atrophaeus TaxID=1452 RepID=UPI00227E10F1|nr:hypothetical protein [Bacillus atrophaeus]MCY8911020.1 hypothetical protein [Bacillus atrophaeus]MEC0837871.1 hypothetical protein [Bacillus atrophaeus]MEC0847330.1 hypothetical protein [Bacillus atrophaeus]MEC0849802.1 hypothetical protein [Bacillus atrophaeus]MEC0866309.1 hypothetical protein [Bacillus atrophaeus]
MKKVRKPLEKDILYSLHNAFVLNNSMAISKVSIYLDNRSEKKVDFSNCKNLKQELITLSFDIFAKGTRFHFIIDNFHVENEDIVKVTDIDYIIDEISVDFDKILKYYEYMDTDEELTDKEDTYTLEQLGFSFDQSDHLVPYDNFNSCVTDWEIGETLLQEALKKDGKIIYEASVKQRAQISWPEC